MNNVLNHDDTPLRRYLLGELPPAEETQVEERLLTDDDYIEHLEIVEEDLIDEYVRGDLPPPQLQNFQKLFLNHPERQKKIRLARALTECAERLAPRPAPQPKLLSRVWAWLTRSIPTPAWSAAAVLIVAGLTFGAYNYLKRNGDLDKAIASLNSIYDQQRPTEARISGLGYAPFTVTLGNEENQLKGMKNAARDYAGGVFSKEALESPSPISHHWLGRFYLTQKKYEQAIEQFDIALKSGGQSGQRQLAQLHSDFAAALLEKAKFGQSNASSASRQNDLNESKKHLDEALRLVDSLPEALFNLGLLYQEQQLWPQAKEVWQKYLKIDPGSKWAADAQQNLKLCEARTKQASLNKDEIREQFLRAYREGNHDLAWQTLSQNREPIGEKLVWWQLADEFLKASTGNQPAEADFFLQALEYAGRLEAERGDHFTSALASFYRSSSNEQRIQIAEARELVKQGHQMLLAAQFNPAAQAYEQAKIVFARNLDGFEAAFAELWKAYCYRMLNKTEQSLAMLSRLAEQSGNERHLWLQSQSLSTIGSIKADNNKYSEGVEYTERALEITEKINDSIGQQDNLFQLANHHKSLHNYEESLGYLRRCLRLAESYYPGHRQTWMNYDLLAQVHSSLFLNSIAADYQMEAVRLAAGKSGKTYQRAVSYAHLGIILGKLQNLSQAIKYMQDSLEESQNCPEEANKIMHQAYAQLHLGHLHRQEGKMGKAINYYLQSIENHKKIHFQAKIYEAHKGILQCYVASNDARAIERELSTVIFLAEKYRSQILQEQQRDIFFDAEQSVYDIAVGFNYSLRRDHRTAFDFSEAPRARSLLDLIKTRAQVTNRAGRPDFAFSSVFRPLKLHELRSRLPDKTQILQYAVLEDKVIAWVVSKDSETKAIDKKISHSELKEKIISYLALASRPSNGNEEAVARKSKELYEILISPVEPYLDKQKQICIVPNKVLNYLPFEALVSSSSGKYAVNEYCFIYAPSSTVYILCSETAHRLNKDPREVLLAVGNPAFDRGKFKLPYLPWAKAEVAAIANHYKEARLLFEAEATEAKVKEAMPLANVIHFAAHNVVDQRSPTLSKILLAGNGNSPSRDKENDGVLQGTEIYSGKFPRTRLVVLAACQSGVERFYNGEGMIGMSRNFIAVGIPLVAASLWPVETASTSNLMISFHKYRKLKGLSSAEALRQAKLDMINHSELSYRHPGYWASFILIGGHSQF